MSSFLAKFSIISGKLTQVSSRKICARFSTWSTRPQWPKSVASFTKKIRREGKRRIDMKHFSEKMFRFVWSQENIFHTKWPANFVLCSFKDSPEMARRVALLCSTYLKTSWEKVIFFLFIFLIKFLLCQYFCEQALSSMIFHPSLNRFSS